MGTSRSGGPRYLTLVTGGAGFIGSHIVDELIRREEYVRVLDNFSTGSEANLASVADSIELIDADLRNRRDVKNAMKGVDAVLHLGALGSVPRSIDDPIATHESNVNGTLNVLLEAKNAGVKRVVYTSSSSVYGDAKVSPKIESLRLNPLSPYAASKLAGEGYCAAFNNVFDLEVAIIRPFNVFGPRQRPDSQYAAVIPRFLTAMLEGRRPVMFGDGHQSRDFTFVENIVKGQLIARDHPSAAGAIFNLACGESHDLHEIVAVANNQLGANIAPEFEPARAGDVRDSLADITAARACGYQPSVKFEEGLIRTLRYFSDSSAKPETGN